MSEIELKLCPFCGGEARMLTDGGGDYYKAFCLGCGTEVPRWFGTEEEAAKKWNTRFADKWISVKDGLPERTGNYLVCGKMHLPQAAFFDISAGGWYDNWITHWMPLPRQPKGMEDLG